uniref:Uncharacterized protein n=1 Tax=Leersia perrieri TaxID=77586 RepID=A0A0D9WX63_9ORYZ
MAGRTRLSHRRRCRPPATAPSSVPNATILPVPLTPSRIPGRRHSICHQYLGWATEDDSTNKVTVFCQLFLSLSNRRISA